MDGLLAAGAPKVRVYLIGAGGCGMSGLGHLLLDGGHSVCGSDLLWNEELRQLSARGAEIHVGNVPVLAGARESLARGFRPAGTVRNAEAFRRRIDVRVDESEYTLMCDAQTSGGLLISVPPERVAAFEQRFRDGGLFYANIGIVTDRSGAVTLVQ